MASSRYLQIWVLLFWATLLTACGGGDQDPINVPDGASLRSTVASGNPSIDATPGVPLSAAPQLPAGYEPLSPVLTAASSPQPTAGQPIILLPVDFGRLADRDFAVLALQGDGSWTVLLEGDAGSIRVRASESATESSCPEPILSCVLPVRLDGRGVVAAAKSIDRAVAQHARSAKKNKPPQPGRLQAFKDGAELRFGATFTTFGPITFKVAAQDDRGVASVQIWRAIWNVTGPGLSYVRLGDALRTGGDARDGTYELTYAYTPADMLTASPDRFPRHWFIAVVTDSDGVSRTWPAFLMLWPKITQSPDTPVIELVQGVEGSTGGTVEVRRPGSPIDGLRVTIAPNSLNAASDAIALGYLPSLPVPLPPDLQALGLMSASPTFSLTRTAKIGFSYPVLIEVPIERSALRTGEPVVLYLDEKTSTYRPVETVYVDRELGRIGFITSHFSIYKVVVWPLEAFTRLIGSYVDTGFRLDRDAFEHPNFTTFNYDGVCYGMVSFAAWHFENQRSTPLISAFREGDAPTLFDEFRVREVIGAAHSATWNDYNLRITRVLLRMHDVWPISAQEQQAFAARRLVAQLSFGPQLLALGSTDGGYLHAVLVYAYNGAGTFYAYDPNNPKKPLAISWTDAGLANIPYGAFEFTRFWVTGRDTWFPPDELARISASSADLGTYRNIHFLGLRPDSSPEVRKQICVVGEQSETCNVYFEVEGNTFDPENTNAEDKDDLISAAVVRNATTGTYLNPATLLEAETSANAIVVPTTQVASGNQLQILVSTSTKPDLADRGHVQRLRGQTQVVLELARLRIASEELADGRSWRLEATLNDLPAGDLLYGRFGDEPVRFRWKVNGDALPTEGAVAEIGVPSSGRADVEVAIIDSVMVDSDAPRVPPARASAKLVAPQGSWLPLLVGTGGNFTCFIGPRPGSVEYLENVGFVGAECLAGFALRPIDIVAGGLQADALGTITGFYVRNTPGYTSSTREVQLQARPGFTPILSLTKEPAGTGFVSIGSPQVVKLPRGQVSIPSRLAVWLATINGRKCILDPNGGPSVEATVSVTGDSLTLSSATATRVWSLASLVQSRAPINEPFAYLENGQLNVGTYAFLSPFFWGEFLVRSGVATMPPELIRIAIGNYPDGRIDHKFSLRIGAPDLQGRSGGTYGSSCQGTLAPS